MPRPRPVFLPPMIQVLHQDRRQHDYTEGASKVIKWVDLDVIRLSAPYKKATRPLPKISPPRPSPRPPSPLPALSDLMKTIDLRDVDDVDSDDVGDDAPKANAKDGEECFSYIVRFPADEAVNDNVNNDLGPGVQKEKEEGCTSAPRRDRERERVGTSRGPVNTGQDLRATSGGSFPVWKNNVMMGLTKAVSRVMVPVPTVSGFKRVQH